MDTILHQTKSFLSFNHLYVIESLDENDGDKLTGTSLLNNLKPYAERCEYLSTSLITVESAQQWYDAMDYICMQARNGQSPILHFEIHGTDSKDGLYIKNGDIIQWPDVLDQISRINYACGCNLFVSFAVCYGQYLVQFIKAHCRMPFCASLGSFEELYEDDLEVRFFAYYKELLTSFDFDKAYQALLDANKDMHSNYKPIKADVLFAQVQKAYLETMCTDSALKQRVEGMIKTFPLLFRGYSKQQLQKFEDDFCKYERENREKIYQEGCENYFNLREQPENRNRFLIFHTTEALLEAFERK